MPKPLLTDSGLEMWLVFHREVDLPDFAAFPLLDNAAGRDLLAEYFRTHLGVAARAGTGLVLETPTWRANRDWGTRLGYDAAALDRVKREAVAFVRGLGDDFDAVDVVVVRTYGTSSPSPAPACRELVIT
jgi:homocysteine S-methyltransferase